MAISDKNHQRPKHQQLDSSLQQQYRQHRGSLDGYSLGGNNFDSDSFYASDNNRRQNYVNDIFQRISKDYDLMNDLMSLGVQRFWKSTLITEISKVITKDSTHIDVASGTGDIAFKLLSVHPRSSLAKVTLVDISSNMLKSSFDRFKINNLEDRAEFVESCGEGLPFADNTFDSYSIVFGIRNISDRNKALAEAFRVLKQGGKFFCLEFSTVNVPLIDKLYSVYSDNIIPLLGDLVAGDREAYVYLVESIKRFHVPQDFSNMLKKAGFSLVDYKSLTYGIVAIHSGWKI